MEGLWTQNLCDAVPLEDLNITKKEKWGRINTFNKSARGSGELDALRGPEFYSQQPYGGSQTIYSGI